MMDKIKRTFSEFAGRTIELGYAGENKTTRVCIDCWAELEQYPGSTVAVKAKNAKGIVYPVNATLEGSAVIWDVSSGDTARAGFGLAQVDILGPNGEVEKSAIAKTVVFPSLDATGNPPSHVEDWITEARQTLEEVKSVVSEVGDKLENGEFKGEPGITPVLGVDYFTAADQQAIVQDVLQALPTYNGEVIA